MTPEIDRIRLPFREQIDFFRQKLNLPSERWDSIEKAAHDRGFIVAGAEAADLVADLRGAVDAGIAGGDTLDDFRKKFGQIVGKHGWTGWAGEGSKAGVAWRTKVIYSTNVRTSYAAGRWAQLNDPGLLAVRPYWRYIHNDSVLHPRPQHAAWGHSGLTLPHDHPFWKTNFPPNGWGCRCTVQAVRGPKEGDATTPPAGWDQRNAKGDLPGVDRGWDYAPGRTWQPDLDTYPYATARAMVADGMKDGVFERWQARIAGQVAEAMARPEYADLAGKALSDRLRADLVRGEEYPVAVIPADKVALLGLDTQVLKFSDYDAIKQAVSRAGDPNFEVNAYRAVQGILDDPELIVREGAQPTIWFKDTDQQLYVAVLWQTKTGKGIYLKSLRMGNAKELARAETKGAVLYRRTAP